MRPQVILDGLTGLQPNESLNAKKIIQWIIEALEVTENVPDFTITSAGVASRALFKHLHSVTAKVVFPFELIAFRESIHPVADGVARLFDATIARDDSLKCWIQIGQFLCDLRKHCKNSLFTVMSGSISVSLLKKMTAVPDFDANPDIIDSMLLNLTCGCAVIRKIYGGCQKPKKMWTHIRTLYVDCINVFFDIFGGNLIFSSNAFFPLTSQILHEGFVQGDTITKYLNAMLFVFGSNNQAGKTNLLRRQDVKERILSLTVVTKTQSALSLLLKVLRTMLEFSREMNVPFDIDWTKIFANTIYRHKDAVKLLLLEAEDARKNKEKSLIKRVIKIYLRRNDECAAQHSEKEKVKRLALLIRGNVDLVTCKELFNLLCKHVEDSPAMCAVIILFIEHSAKAIARQSTFHDQRYSKLMNTLFDHIDHVEPYPELLSRVINIFNTDNLYPHLYMTKKILTIVPEAFHRCDQYGTAIDLLKVLKAIGYGDAKPLELFEKLLLQDTSGVRSKETLVLMLAANDVFDIFMILDPMDKIEIFRYYKKRFDHCDEQNQCSVLYASLMVHMLAAIHLTTESFPGEAINVVDEAQAILKYLSARIQTTEPLSFASVHVGIAICVYQTTFKSHVSDKGMLMSLKILGQASIEFRLNYELDAKKDAAINDLRLLTKFWQCAAAVYQGIAPDGFAPSAIFEIYPRIETHLVDVAEEFLATILEYSFAARNKLFLDSVHYLMKCERISNKNRILNKLLGFVARKENADKATYLALMIFIKNVELLDGNFHLHHSLYNIQVNLYKNYMKNNGRKADLCTRHVMDRLNARINAREGDAQKHFVELRNCLQEKASLSKNDPAKVDDNKMDHGKSSDDGDELTGVDDSDNEVSMLVPVNVSCLE